MNVMFFAGKWILRTAIWTVALLLLSVAITDAVFWYRGQFIYEVFQYDSDRGQLKFTSGGGWVWLERISEYETGQLDFINSHPKAGPIRHGVHKTPPDVRLPDYFQPSQAEIKVSYTQRWGVVICRTKLDDWGHWFRDRNGVWHPFVDRCVIKFRPWITFTLAIPFFVMVGLPTARWRKRRRRRKAGHCVGCDYDLRATTSGICPECGLPFDPRKLGYQRKRRLHPRVDRAIVIGRWTLATLGMLIAVAAVILWHRAYENVGYTDRVSWISPMKVLMLGSFDGKVFYMHSANDLPDHRVQDEQISGFHYGAIRWGEKSLTFNQRLSKGLDMTYYWDALGVTAYKWRHVGWGKHSESDGDIHTLFSMPIWWLLLLGIPLPWMSLRWSLRKPRQPG